MFVFFLPWSCYWVEELYQPCLPAGEIKKKPAVLGLMSPACWFIPPQDPSLFLSFCSSLVSSAAQGGVDKVIIYFLFLAQTFSFSLKHTHKHLHWTLSPAGSLGLWKKRALWLRAACWACSKHTHSASGGEELGKERPERTQRLQNSSQWPVPLLTLYIIAPTPLQYTREGKIPVTGLDTPK